MCRSSGSRGISSYPGAVQLMFFGCRISLVSTRRAVKPSGLNQSRELALPEGGPSCKCYTPTAAPSNSICNNFPIPIRIVPTAVRNAKPVVLSVPTVSFSRPWIASQAFGINKFTRQPLLER